jgi:hypothetical protein
MQWKWSKPTGRSTLVVVVITEGGERDPALAASVEKEETYFKF